jgi:L-threonylcarbamoyladenylate synthase
MAANPASSDNEGVFTPLKTLRLNPQNPRELAQAAEILRAGGTVAFPTETVYGLGANALSPQAVEKIFVAKQRPHWDPLIVHVASRSQVPEVASDLPPIAEALMEAFWPGPLTLLLPKTDAIPDAVTAGRPLVGVRIPNHPVAQALLRAAGIPIAAPSANTFGHTSPTTAAHVLADLDGRIDAILDGGPTEVGLESTVAEVQSYDVVVYRQGAIDLAMLDSIVGAGGTWVHLPEASDTPPASLPSPGVGIRHYAPNARVILVGGIGGASLARSNKPLELSLVSTIDTSAAHSEKVGVLLPDTWNASCADHIFRWGPWHQPEILAQRLYTGLRQLDDRGCTVIIAPIPESPGIAEAIRDRLQKAARPS